ncbi:MAG: prephenate dehydratase [Verrucomicrobia bacterium]|nr:prephenate dehydratase [Verrucomicrobiota bacterium]
MNHSEVAYLGPVGTFSHLMARKRFGSKVTLTPLPGIYEVFAYVRKQSGCVGIVPIENSSGGTIYETIDCLVEARKPLFIREELSLHVQLALLGHRGKKIHSLHSHFVPMQHCDQWIRRNLPHVVRKEAGSTALAADIAARDPHAAALGMKQAARQYGLDILEFPVSADVPNVTQFVTIGKKAPPAPGSSKTSLLVTLHNRPGSLCEYLEVFRDHAVDLTRLLSRPLIGKPNSYIFFIDVKGVPEKPEVGKALAQAKRIAESMRIIGVYPVRSAYRS